MYNPEGVLPDPGLFLSVATSQELSESLYHLSKSFVLSNICLLGFLKINFYYVSYFIRQSVNSYYNNM